MARKKDVDDEIIYKGLKKLVKSDDKAMITLCTHLDQVVFMEL